MADILAGDIGGTKCHLALFDEAKRNEPLFPQTFASREYHDLTTLILDYLEKVGKEREIISCAFAVAGPVHEGKCHTTNLLWTIDAKTIARETGIQKVVLLNDIEAAGWAIESLSPDSFHQLKWGADELHFGNRAILSPGTGLGEAGIFWDGKAYHPFATEGGHSDFAPYDPLQIELLSYLIPRFGHVSYERILSGPGISLLFDFFHKEKKREVPPHLLEEIKNSKDPTLVIADHGLKGDVPICREVLDLFSLILGQEAGNLALKFMAVGGVYFGGGIPKKILKKLREKNVTEGFVSKGRFRSLLESIPIYVILDDYASLKGAAHQA